LQTARALPALLIAIVIFGVDTGAADDLDTGGFALVGGGLLVVAVVVGGLGWVSWRRRVFWFDEAGDLRVDSGVLSRQERRLALSRLQSVDVQQPLVARIVGFAEVRVEVAGTGDSRVVLQYLTDHDARALREEVLARAAGLRPDAGEAPEEVLVTVPTPVLVQSLLRSPAFVWGIVGTAAVIAVTIVSGGFQGILLLLVTGGIPAVAVVQSFLRHYGFTLAESPDGLRLRSGLTSTMSLTVPPGRVHAVAFVQPFLWRSRDWVRVELTLAGVQVGDGDQGGFSGVLLPVAPAPLAAAVVDRIVPGLQLEQLSWHPAPAAARWRAPIQWRHLGVAVDERVAATREGRFVRRTAVVPHARVQSIHLRQGPWQRRLGLATTLLDLAPGVVRAAGRHLDAATARHVLDELAARGLQSRRVATPDRWAHPGGSVTTAPDSTTPTPGSTSPAAG
jgi:putative membrane protein